MDLLEWYNTHQSTDRLKKLNEESSNTINYYNTKINNGEWLSTKDLDKYNKAISDYIDSSNRFREYNKSFGTTYSDEDEKSWNEIVSSLQNGYTSVAQYYSQFGSKIDMDEFNLNWTRDDNPTAESITARQNAYESNKQRIAELEKSLNFTAGSWLPNFAENIFLSKEDEALRDELEGLRKSNERYEALQMNLDKYYDFDTERFTKSAESGWNRYLSDVEAAREEEESTPRWLYYLSQAGNSANTEMPLSGVTQTQNDLRRDTTHKTPNDKWSAEQKQMFGHLYNVDPDTAFNYAMEINSRINAEKEEEALKTISEISTSGFWAGAGNTLGAIAGAMTGGADFLYDMAQMQAWGRTMSDGSVSPFEYSEAVTGSISTKLNDMGGTLDESIPLIGGKGWGDVYGLGVEIAKSLASKPLGGTGTLISYFGQGAASSFDDAKKRGATDEQALLYGISNGIFEGLAEKYSIETLLSAKTTGNFIKDLLSTMGKQFLTEGQEEGLTSLLTNIADNVIMQDKSNYNALVRQYIAQGMSESEAEKKALWDSVEGILFDAIAGGVSGSVSGGLTATANHMGYNMAASKHGQSLLQKKSVDPLMQLANDMAGVSKTVDKTAQKVSTNASAKNVGRLSFAMQDSIREQNRAEIEKALTEKGLSKKEAKRVSEYLATNKPTAEQTAEIEGNENIKAVVKELLANPSSSINDRSMSLVAARLGKVYKSSTIASDKAKIGKEAVIKEVNVKDKVSKDGKTVKNSTGEAVTINKNNPIATIEVEKDDNGNVIKRTVYYNTDKGKVASDDISYANETEALLYESFVDMSPVVANGIIKNYDGKTPVQTYINGMREGVLVYGMHNFQGIGKDISSKGFFASLSEVDQAIALRIGRSYATTIAKADGNKINIKKAEASANASTDTSVKKTAKEGTVTFEEGAKIESHKEDKAERRAEIKAKSRAVDLGKVIAKVTGINIVFYDARNTKYKDGEGANGFFDMDTDTIYLDLRNATDETRTIAYTLSHELVHFIKKWSPTKFDTLAKFLMENYASHGVNSSALLANKMAKNNNDADRAYEEMIADACETMLLDSNAVVKLMELRKADLELFEKIKLHILKILNGIRDAYKSLGYQANTEEGKSLLAMTDILEQMYTLFEDAAVEAVENFQAVESIADLEPNTDIIQVEGTVKHSYKSLAQAAGFEAIEDENGVRSFIRDGKAVSKVTIEDIENSPIGAFINYSLDKKDITKEQADEQKKLFADICTLACQTNDFAMTMQFVGSEVFTAMKANADKQYGTTYDMPSICTKTQAVIDAMSARMVKLGRGLTTEEITAIYNEVNHAGNPVPCPECYVFSRWIGIGGLLNNIKQYQDYYGKMSVSEVAEAYKNMRAEIETAAAKMEISFGKAKGALVKKYTSEYNKLTDKIAKQENQGEKVKEADRKKLAELESMQNTVKAMTWIENVYFADSSLTKVNKNFKVPDDVLFDLNMGEKFATQYKEAWAFRTTQGAGYGKAITPYAEVTLGEGILVTNNTTNAIKGKQNGTLNNYFLQQRGQMNAEARKALDRARLKQKIQAFLGGQRFQSTSDARYENASDYLLAALEMQAMHGKVQVYTKVDGAVPAFEAWGFSSNQSLMPKGGGLDENGNVKDTSVGGMNPKVAFANRNKHEHAGTITIGVNDNHIRALFALINRDFIIPYHASGGKADVVAEFRRIQEGQAEKDEMVRSTDYSRTQSDKVLSDEVLRWLGKTDAEIEQIHKVREARIAILTGGKVNMDVVRGNRFLSALYDKFHGGEWDGVKLAKSKVESQIFPNEFWDETVTYDESGQITLDYLEYCDDLGFLHRFSGLVPSNGMLVPINGYDENGKKVPLTDLAFKYENGKRTNMVEDFYWKVLTDRRMYGHNGQYLRQQTVSLNSTTEDTVTTFAKNNDGRQYDKEKSLATANKVSSETWGNIVEEVGAENIPEATEQYTDVENTTRIKKQKKETSDNTYESIGKELMYYEEGDLAPDLTLVETINDRTGNKEITIKHHGQKPKNYVPKKIAYCYKLFEQHPDGTLHALFAGASNAVPLNEWRYAQGFPRNDAGVKGMNLRERYGWHLSAGLPSAPHLMSSKYFERGYPSKNSYGHPKGSKRVWVRMAYDASTDFNSIADSTGRENDIYGLIPFGGYYAFKENNQSEWVISSAVKIDKILDEKERQQILKDAGFDEYEAWRLKFQATPEEKAARELAAKERQKAKARAKKLGIDSELTESTKAMRETIKSRIIDNPELKSNIKKQAKENTEKILMGSLFSGGGTLEAGLTYQMLDKQFGVEYDGRIASVYADNHGDHIQVGRVEDFDISKYDDIFYLHASPVCHNFSTAKHGAKELQQDIDSARATAKHLETAKPQVFTVENAPGYRKSESLKVITNKLTELGYKWDVDVYNSADYGSATSRNRVILRAVKEGELPPKPIKQERTNSWDKVTRDLWNTLPKSNLRPSFISAIENTPKLPILDANGKVNVNKPLLILTTTNAHTVTFCWEGEICPTLTTKCGEAKLVMPDGYIYAVTPEFMGRIQGLPDDYKYPKEKTRAFTIIGNGIPTHLTKAVVGGVLDSAYEQTHDGRVLYQKKEVSNRTLLANALESTIDSSTQAGQNELEKLKEYKSKVAMLETEEEHLAEVKSQIDEIMYKKSLSIGKEKYSVKEFEQRAKKEAEKQGLSADDVTFKLDRENNKYIAYVGNKELLSADKTFRSKEDTEKLKALNEDKTITSNKINTLDRQLLKYEAMKPIKDVLAREKELVRKRTEEKGREALEAYKEKMLKVQKEQIGQARELRSKAIARVKESRDKQEARAKLTKLVLDTVKWITHPDKTDVRCPDMLKAPYQEFLESINLDSKRALNGGEATHNDLRVASAMQSLALVVEKIRATQANGEGDASGFLDIPGDFVAVLRTMAEDIKKMMVGGDFVVNKMTATEIKQITKLVRTLNHAIKEMNTTHANLRFANAAALGDSSVNFLDSMGKTKSTNSVKDFINWDNALPFYAFKKFGEAGESVFEELMDAQDKMAFLAQTILDFTSKTWTDKEADEWGKDTHTIELSDDKTLTLTSADAMGIYCLSRRDNGQGLNHLLGGGVRVIGLTKGATKAQDSRSTLTLADMETIINSLSKRQIEVAEAIQKFMSTVCSEWGNEISMKRFLTKDFTEKLYYPIESNNENLNTELPEASQSDLYRLLNISATKPLTQNANNQIVIRNIFDVFTNHAADMARLNAYGMALLDYMKWVNYRERIEKDNGQIETRGVRQSMNTAYGDKAIRYVLNLIKDINGRAGDVGSHPWLSKMTRMAKTASVAGNVRVMLLQVTAYPRAAMVLPVDSLAKGLMKIPQIEKTKKYCGIALWKSFGFFDTNIARSIEDQIKGTKNIRAKLIELSMKGAEYADAITWGALWNACEYEVAKTTKNKVGSEAFYYEVGKKLRDVVYATQVVDSVLTRSQLMRNKDGLTQMATAYMSEPTLTANILMDAGFQFTKAKRLGLPTKDAWNHLGRTIGVYTSVAVFTTLIESLADAFRDEDDEEFAEKFAEALLPNLISNVVPFNKLPIIADISDAVQSLITGDKYFTTEIMSSQWITQTVYAINAWKSVLSGKNTPTTVYDALFKSIKAISFMTGLPISNAMRDLVALWNNIIGAINEDLKID